MKVGITTFGGDGGRSGISRYIIHLLRALAALDDDARYEVILYADERDLFLPASPCMAALPFGAGLRGPLLNVAWHQLRLGRWCRRRGYDVLFLPAANRRAPMTAPCPTVGTVHDFSSLHVAGKYDPLRMLYIRRVLPLLIRRLTRVITISESSRRDIVEYAGVPPERVTVIPEAADATVYFPRDRDEARARVASRYGVRTPYVLYVARIEHPGKNHVRLIRAFERLKQSADLPHQLVLAGSDWTRAEEVHRAAAAASCAADILFTGFVPDDDLPFLYSAADLFAFPSLYEGFGLPLLEAMSCGVAVACADISSLPEVAGDAAALFDPYDEAAMAETMRALLTDADRRADFVRRGRERSRRYSWQETARRTLDVLREAAAEATP